MSEQYSLADPSTVPSSPATPQVNITAQFSLAHFLRPITPSGLVTPSPRTPMPCADSNETGLEHSSSFGKDLETMGEGQRHVSAQSSQDPDASFLVEDEQRAESQGIFSASENVICDITSLFTPAHSQASSIISTADMATLDKEEKDRISEIPPPPTSVENSATSGTVLHSPLDLDKAPAETSPTESSDQPASIFCQSTTVHSESASASATPSDLLAIADSLQTQDPDEDMEDGNVTSTSLIESKALSEILEAHIDSPTLETSEEQVDRDEHPTVEDRKDLRESFLEPSYHNVEEYIAEADSLVSSPAPSGPRLSASLALPPCGTPAIDSDVPLENTDAQAQHASSSDESIAFHALATPPSFIVRSKFFPEATQVHPIEKEQFTEQASVSSPTLQRDDEMPDVPALLKDVDQILDKTDVLNDTVVNDPEYIAPNDQMRSSSPFSSSVRLFTSSPMPSSQSSAIHDSEWEIKPADIPTLDEELSMNLGHQESSEQDGGLRLEYTEDEESTVAEVMIPEISSSPLPPSSPQLAASSPVSSQPEINDETSEPMLQESTTNVPTNEIPAHSPDLIIIALPPLDDVDDSMTQEFVDPEMSEPSANKESHSEAIADSTPNMLKRKASQEWTFPVEKKPRIDLPPAPKRSTFASQRKEFKKLITPFRPLTIVKAQKTEDCAPMLQRPSPPLPVQTEVAKERKRASRTKLKHRTERAGGQFKSPLGVLPSTSASVRMTPTIQALERKIQNLRRAVKVKNQGEEAILQGLTKRWLEAGREVAYELWQLVKDGSGSSGDVGGKKDDPWAQWGSDADSKKKDEGWGWEEAPVKAEDDDEAGVYGRTHEVEEEPEVHQSLGLMLRQLGIAPETLGWDEREEVFVDMD